MPLSSVAADPSSFRPWRSSLLLLVIALTVAVFPLWIIQPFKAQSPRVLPFALAAFRFGPWITLLCAVAIAWVLVKSFQLRRQRIFALACFLLIAIATLISHTNVFEKMFHPAGEPSFVPASTLALADNDILMSVTSRGETHAYPLLAIAYHHIINDRLAGDPIVATY